MTYHIHLQGVPLADFNGRRGPSTALWNGRRFSATSFATLLPELNQIFSPADIEFHFDPADWQPLRHTYLNNMDTSLPNWWVMPNALASLFPEKLVIFFRYGPGVRRSGYGLGQPPRVGQPLPGSWPLPADNVNFIAMPSSWKYVNAWPQARLLAHELGHYLGLFHTFPGSGRRTIYGESWETLSAEQAQAMLAQYIMNHGGNAAEALNGDGLPDTPPDPGDFLFRSATGSRCGGGNPYLISGSLGPAAYAHAFHVERVDNANVMSYYGRCANSVVFSDQQIAIMHQALNHPYRRQLWN